MFIHQKPTLNLFRGGARGRQARYSRIDARMITAAEIAAAEGQVQQEKGEYEHGGLARLVQCQFDSR
jgi:hypothetical protein